METKVNGLIASAMLLISSGLVPAMPEKASQHVSNRAGTCGPRNRATHSAAPQRTDRKGNIMKPQNRATAALTSAWQLEKYL